MIVKMVNSIPVTFNVRNGLEVLLLVLFAFVPSFPSTASSLYPTIPLSLQPLSSPDIVHHEQSSAQSLSYSFYSQNPSANQSGSPSEGIVK